MAVFKACLSLGVRSEASSLSYRTRQRVDRFVSSREPACLLVDLIQNRPLWNQSAVSYLRFEGSCISHSEAMW